ncbi:MAG: hypothetical protein WD557_10775 [Dehalococcoidia bacterium]
MGLGTYIACGAGAAAVVGGSVAFMASGSSTAGDSPYEAPNFDSSVPHGSLSDWISYGDYVVVGTVIGESEVGERQVHGDGTSSVGRSVTLRVERTIWAAPGFEQLESVEVSDWGWSIVDNRRQASNDHMKVGERYMLPLARFERGWGYIGLRGYKVDGDRLTRDLSNGRTWLKDLGGMPLEDLESALGVTEPDPRVVPLRHLSANQCAEEIFGGAMAHP